MNKITIQKYNHSGLQKKIVTCKQCPEIKIFVNSKKEHADTLLRDMSADRGAKMIKIRIKV